MNKRRSLSTTCLVIHVGTNHLTAALASSDKVGCALSWYEWHEATQIIHEGQLTDPSWCKQKLAAVVEQLPYRATACVIMLDGVCERWIATPSWQHVPVHQDYDERLFKVQTTYIAPLVHDLFLHYVAAIPYPLLLSVQLLAISLRLNIVAITTSTTALHYAYKLHQGRAFRAVTLAQELQRTEGKLQTRFNAEHAARLINTHASCTLDYQRDYPYVLPVVGAHTLFKEHYAY